MKRFFALLIVFGLAAAGYWYYETSLKFMLQPQPVEIAPQRWQIAGKTGSNGSTAFSFNATETNASLMVNPTNATVDNATTFVAIPSDAIVTHAFVHDVARYVISRYHPAQTPRNPSASARLDLNIKSMNVHYAMEMPGIILDKGDTLKARKLLFSHALSPTVLDFLQNAYVPLFLESLDRQLAELANTTADGKVLPIGETQRRELLTMLAARVRNLGMAITALARTSDIAPLIGKYQEDVDKVNDAHVTFWNIQHSNATEVEVDEAGTKIKVAIQSREMSRQRLLQTIVARISPQGLEAADLIYLAQWVHRRELDRADCLPQVAMAGELLVKLAGTLEDRARIPLDQALTNATNSSLPPQ